MTKLSLLVSASAAIIPLTTANPIVRRQLEAAFDSPGNPILGDGSVYSADPAPFVVDDTVYILAGHDEADTSTNDFVMNEWLIFEAQNPDPAGGSWTLHESVASPEGVFSWATAGGAYASQIVQGADGRFYLYACAQQASGGGSDPFSIGVGVSDSPTGPFEDAHPDGPIISQVVPSPGNDIHNIDPTVLVDDGRVFVYWGSFNQLRGLELDSDMTTVVGDVISVDSLTGYFEAPWLMKRGDTYYMLYAANNAGPDSPCTPTSYHACIAYGTASDPLGPWTSQGVVLDIVSSTTSHPGTYQLGEEWFLVYHTADAEGGGHFRRSVAFDALEFDDSASPPSILKVEQTWRDSLTEPRPPNRNVAPLATSVESENGTPIQYWIAALNDERILENPLPPDYWSSYAAEQSPETSTLTYTWDSAMDLNGVAIAFFADQPAGSDVGVPPPASWHAEYLADGGSWTEVAASGSYPTEPSLDPAEVSFETVTTTSFRVVLQASGSGTFGGVGIHEWKAFSPEPV